MPLVAFVLLLVLFLVSGFGLLHLFGLRLKAAYTVSLSLLLGVALASFLPFVLQLFYIDLTGVSIFTCLTLAAVALVIPVGLSLRKEGWASYRRSLFPAPVRVYSYEVPFLMIIGFFILVSVWRCYYLPPTSRDALSGPEAIAEIAVREHTMINSFFNVDLWSTNNQFKSPFLISLQLIYKLAGFPFGQIWLSIIFTSFTVFVYNALKEKVHPILAGLLLLIFFMTPEMYAYTFMILYDYSNMVYMFLGLYFLFGYFQNGVNRYFYFAGVLIGIATYIRSETLALLLLFLPPILLAQRREKLSLKKAALADLLFFIPSLVGYYLPTQLYIKHYLPVHYDVGGLINNHLTNLSPLFQRYSDIVTRLLVSEFAIHLWGYIFYLTFILFVAEAVLFRRFTRDARNWLYAFAALYLGLGVLGWLLPMMNLNETTKRAMFKMLPVAIFYLANNQLLLRLSQSITRWENKPWSIGAAGKQPAPAQKAVLTKSGKTVAAGSTAGRRRKK
jgi:Dolichyl-phosphate-mannose-protein mannosyltransferase